jgi:hypothetical protein
MPHVKTRRFACAAAASIDPLTIPGTIHGGLASIAVQSWRSGVLRHQMMQHLGMGMMFEEGGTGYNVGNAV